MKNSFNVVLLLLAACCTTMTSCRRAAEKAGRKIRIEAVEKVERRGLTGAEVVVRVRNGSGYKLLLDKATLDLYYGDARVGRISLREGIEVPRRTTASVSTQWQVRISDPLALYMLAKKLQRNELAQAAVSFSIEGRGGPAPVAISRERMPLSEFLSIFGLGTEDLKNFLNE